MLEEGNRPSPVDKPTTIPTTVETLVDHPRGDGSSPQNSVQFRSHGIEDISRGQETEYEGDSSLAAHANFTARVLEGAVTTDLSMSRCGELASMIRNMQHANMSASANDADNMGNNGPTPASEPRRPSLPPVQLTLNCLRMLKENPVMRFFWSMEFESVGQVTEQLLSADSTDTRPSPAELIITYIGLHWLFTQCSHFAMDPAIKSSCAAEAQGCREHADVVLAQLPFHLPANMDHVLALTMAVSAHLPPVLFVRSISKDMI
ncbi:hypothetical protein INS49_004357 [Diaporthe citri]|uniref:uncharacterized protein n=1 Tax=Diaporthe citri TaxID=83186 RepID=UPI001C80571F|nr:uncharacterized protein INS49_004357 [Diaporthe citri]KAG6354340.1 hypothetical protein INS49_004357 [Diaporthe citri]